MISSKQMLTPKLVTIALPMWKRMEYLPHILKVIEAQDYPFIHLLISDNGMNGNKVRDAVETHYSRPFTFRQNPSIAEIPDHFNQLISEATGEYFTLVSDDDEISPNFISELVGLLEKHPQASLALARQEIMNGEGVVVRKSNDVPTTVMSGAEFIRKTWQHYSFGYEALGTNVARTTAIVAAGGYPNFTRGTGMENAMIIKVCLNSHVAISQSCVWRWRVYESSHGWSVPISDLAASAKEFMRFLDTDPGIRELAKANPEQWKELREVLFHNEWQTYYWRWRDIYKSRMSYPAWVRAAFAMPFFPDYYRNVASVFRNDAKTQIKKLFGKRDPSVGEVGYFERH
jgi:glycosyltransferase involved in cell wall biosynthesis